MLTVMHRAFKYGPEQAKGYVLRARAGFQSGLRARGCFNCLSQRAAAPAAGEDRPEQDPPVAAPLLLSQPSRRVRRPYPDDAPLCASDPFRCRSRAAKALPTAERPIGLSLARFPSVERAPDGGRPAAPVRPNDRGAAHSRLSGGEVRKRRRARLEPRSLHRQPWPCYRAIGRSLISQSAQACLAASWTSPPFNHDPGRGWNVQVGDVAYVDQWRASRMSSRPPVSACPSA